MSGIDGNQILAIMKDLKIPCTPRQIALQLAKKTQKEYLEVMNDVLVTLMSGVRFGYIECIHKKYYKIKNPNVLFNLLDLRKEDERPVAPKQEQKPKKKSVKKRKTPAKGRKKKRCKQCADDFAEDADTDPMEESTADGSKWAECACENTNEDINQCCCMVDDIADTFPQQNTHPSDIYVVPEYFSSEHFHLVLSETNQNVQTSESKINIALQSSSETTARISSSNCCNTRSCKYCACRAEYNEVKSYDHQSRKSAAEWSQRISDNTRKLVKYYRSSIDSFRHGSTLQKDSDVVTEFTSKSNSSMTNQHLQKSENNVYTSCYNTSEFEHSDEEDNTSDSH